MSILTDLDTLYPLPAWCDPEKSTTWYDDNGEPTRYMEVDYLGNIRIRADQFIDQGKLWCSGPTIRWPDPDDLAVIVVHHGVEGIRAYLHDALIGITKAVELLDAWAENPTAFLQGDHYDETGWVPACSIQGEPCADDNEVNGNPRI